MACKDGAAHRFVKYTDRNFVVHIYCKVCGIKPWKKKDK